MVEYAAAMTFHPPSRGYSPWYAREGSDKVKTSEIFGMTQKNIFDPKQNKNILFPESTSKKYFKSLGPQLPFCDVFFDRFVIFAEKSSFFPEKSRFFMIFGRYFFFRLFVKRGGSFQREAHSMSDF